MEPADILTGTDGSSATERIYVSTAHCSGGGSSGENICYSKKEAEFIILKLVVDY